VPDARRSLPSVSALLESDAVRALLERAPRSAVVEAVRAVVAEARDGGDAPRDESEWSRAVGEALERRTRPSLRPLFNATGVVLHTNLGRAPLAERALDAVRAAAAGFCDLEYDVAAGARGSRDVHCVALLRELTGAEDALVVNNCAAALVLALGVLAGGREAVVSRGELVEIGGSFRVPDIMARSGAQLVEVGTTNRTHLADYRAALSPRTGALVKVHRSNFAIHGFTAEVTAAELAVLAREASVPLVHDFGSGLLIPLTAYGLRGEPTARDAVHAGASLVLMSGDKLLGGPQAGIILGEADRVQALRRDPLARALRVDKMTLAALEATLALYRDPARAVREVPALAMLTASADEVAARAGQTRAALDTHGVGAEVVASEASVGGGAFPTARIASWALALDVALGSAGAVEQRLRAAAVPVVGRIAGDRVLLDLRSIPAAHDAAFIHAVATALGRDA
jgi:L-seryl-tRNA(Ser) seleniumtransferase